jgi:hypothetical protein
VLGRFGNDDVAAALEFHRAILALDREVYLADLPRVARARLRRLALIRTMSGASALVAQAATSHQPDTTVE